MSRPRRTGHSWLASRLGRPLPSRVEPGSWLSEQIKVAVSDALHLRARGASDVWLLYRHGDVVVSPERELEGYELVTGLPVPMGTKAELTEWIRERLSRVTC